MKIKALIIFILLFFTSISIAEASSILLINKEQVKEDGNDGRIYGLVENQGRCMIIGLPNLKVACRKNLKNFEIEVTDENGFFEFSDLTYDNSETKYYLWILPGQNVIFPGIKTVELNDENSEQDVYYFVLLSNIIKKNNTIKNLIGMISLLSNFLITVPI